MKPLKLSVEYHNGEVVYNAVGGDIPPGLYYLENATSKSQKQNKLFHLLIAEWERTGLHSFDTSKKSLKDNIKEQWGEKVPIFIYLVNNTWQIAQDAKDVPEGCIWKKVYWVKSWAVYTIPQGKKLIDRLINAMIESGVNTPTFESIVLDYRGI